MQMRQTIVAADFVSLQIHEEKKSISIKMMMMKEGALILFLQSYERKPPEVDVVLAHET
jgi:hypothetical protein